MDSNHRHYEVGEILCNGTLLSCGNAENQANAGFLCSVLPLHHAPGGRRDSNPHFGFRLKYPRSVQRRRKVQGSREQGGIGTHAL